MCLFQSAVTKQSCYSSNSMFGYWFFKVGLELQFYSLVLLNLKGLVTGGIALLGQY